jgi:hypothetical protein
MLRLTLLNSNESSIFKTQFSSIFSTIKPYKFKKDIWDFGDRLCIGNRATNVIQLWEVIDRNAIEININGLLYEIYIDILSYSDVAGYGPSERKTTECIRYDASDVALEIDDVAETLLISLKEPEKINEIYDNLKYLLQDQSFSISKYNWIGSEIIKTRILYESRKMNNKKKKEILAKIPRIALSAVVNNNRKRT